MENPFGFVVIDKPSGITSHDCVHKLRKIFGLKRIGHGGTLDPSVTGVLPLAIGNATRLLPYLPSEKTYIGLIQLGKTTNTDDLEGETIRNLPLPKVDFTGMNKFLDDFRGQINQRPPQFSSVHVQGVRAHKRARRGETFNLPNKSITIHALDLLDWNQSKGLLKVYVHCSSGTYIRSIARDLGEKIGCGGCLAKLRRIQALGFKEDQAIRLPENDGAEISFKPEIISPLSALKHLARLRIKTDKEMAKWQTGQRLIASLNQYEESEGHQTQSNQELENSVIVVDSEERAVGIAFWDSPSTLKPKVVLNAKG